MRFYRAKVCARNLRASGPTPAGIVWPNFEASDLQTFAHICLHKNRIAVKNRAELYGALRGRLLLGTINCTKQPLTGETHFAQTCFFIRLLLINCERARCC